jgi:hypothetical protein
MHYSSLYILTLSILLNSACGTSTEPTKSLISLPEGNETKVNDLDQTQLDELCSQAQQAGLDYMEQHQANLCGVTALLAEEQLGMDCDGEYEKCMAIDIQADFLGLCAAADGACDCDWIKHTHAMVYNCHNTVTEFGSCLAETYDTVKITHDALTVRCSDKDSANAFYEMSQETRPPCLEEVFGPCFLVLWFNWSFKSETLYTVLYGANL